MGKGLANELPSQFMSANPCSSCLNHYINDVIMEWFSCLWCQYHQRVYKFLHTLVQRTQLNHSLLRPLCFLQEANQDWNHGTWERVWLTCALEQAFCWEAPLGNLVEPWAACCKILGLVLFFILDSWDNGIFPSFHWTMSYMCFHQELIGLQLTSKLLGLCWMLYGWLRLTHWMKVHDIY